MNFKTNLITRQAELTKEIPALEKFIAKLPESKLIAWQKGGITIIHQEQKTGGVRKIRNGGFQIK